jgi:hypothetical protein
VGSLDLSGVDYTLMTNIIKALTFKMMSIIIDSFELAKLRREAHPKQREPP